MPSSGRYQSQVLSFLSQQSLKLRDRALRGLRQVQVAAVWGAQVVLYPVYLAFQTTRLVSRQIGRSVHRVFPALRAAAQAVQQNTQPPSQSPPTVPPLTDTPIRRTLQSLQMFGLPVPLNAQVGKLPPLPEATNPPLPGAAVTALQVSHAAPLQVSADPTGLAAPESGTESLPVTDTPSSSLPRFSGAAPIQGIATLLASRRLVLVDVENRVQDVLTPQQEIYLKRRIIWELADFWREHRRFLRAAGLSMSFRHHKTLNHQTLSGQVHASTFLPLPADRETLAPPVRLFRRLMAWMQTSPVAVSVNLFQESRLVPLPSSMAVPPGETSVAAWPEVAPVRPLPPAASPTEPRPSLWQRWQNLLRTINPLVDHRPDPHQGDRSPSQQTPPVSRPGLRPAHPVNPDLYDIWFDPDYRGDSEGWQSANQLSQTRRHSEFPPIVPSLPVRAKPYLAAPPLWSSYASMGADLADAIGGAIARIQPMEQESDTDIDTFMLDYAAASVPIQDLEQYLAEYLQQTDLAYQRSFLATTQTDGAIDEVSWDATSRHRSSGGAMQPRAASGGELNPPNLQDESDEATLLPTWIETPATLIRYEKHPLEQILGWLDQGMLWIEQRIASLFDWVRSQLGNRSENENEN